MNSHILFRGALDAIVLVGAVLLFISLFSVSGRQAPAWMRRAVLMSSVIALLRSALGLILHFFSASLSRNAYYQIAHQKIFMTGAAVAVLLFLLISPEFYASFCRWCRPRKAIE